MPSVVLNIGPAGPLIQIYVGISFPHQQMLINLNKPVPKPILCSLLVDTGASGVCIDKTVLSGLSLAPTGTTQIHTPSTSGTPMIASQYAVSLSVPIPGNAPWYHNALPVIEADFHAQGIHGLLGRDILQYTTLIYAGPSNVFHLNF